MATIRKIDGGNSYSKRNNQILTPKNTGYAAGVAMLAAGLRACSKKKGVVKTHKIIGYIAILLTLLHIGIVEYLHYKYKKM